MKKRLTHKELLLNAVAPSVPISESNRLIVGDLKENQILIEKKLDKFLTNNNVSHSILITGNNGNGKSFLNNIICRLITEKNENSIADGKLPILYSKFNFFDETHFISQFLTNLKFSENFSAKNTFAIIGIETFREFEKNVKLPFFKEVFTRTPSILKNVIKKHFFDYFEDKEKDIPEDEINKFIDAQFKKVTIALNKRLIRTEFKKYCKEKTFGPVLYNSILEDTNKFTSTADFNKNIERSIKVVTEQYNILKSIEQIPEISKPVNTKLIVLMIDDYNQKSPDYITKLLDNISSYEDFKVLIIISTLEEKWQEFKRNAKSDFSLEKLERNKIELKSPNKESLIELIGKLKSIIEHDIQKENAIIDYKEEYKEEILKLCQLNDNLNPEYKSYRICTEIIINRLLTYRQNI